MHFYKYKPMNLSKYFFYLIFIFSNLFFSQNGFENYRFFDLKSTISKRAITSIKQDKNGFIWFGTNGSGLYKYDGKDYTHFEFDWNIKNSINSNFIYYLHIDNKNKIWIGTEEGLSIYDSEFDKFNSFKPSFLKDQDFIVKSIVSIDENNLLLGTETSGLYQFDRINEKFTKIDLKIKNKDLVSIKSIVKWNNQFFIGTNIGLLQYDNKLNKIISLFRYNKELSYSIETVLLDNKNRLLLGTTSEGIIVYNIHSKKSIKKNLTNKKIFTIVENPDHSFFVGTENDGLLLINSEGDIIKRYLENINDINNIRSNSIWALYTESNRLWIGYYNKGLSVFDKVNKKFNSLSPIKGNQNSLQNSSVTAIAKDKKGNFWFSLDGGGVDMFIPQSKSFKHYNSNNSNLLDNYVQSVYCDSKNNIWLGTWNKGVFLLPDGGSSFINFNSSNSKNLLSDRILNFKEDKKGRVWIATFINGLHYYDLKTKTFHNFNDSKYLKYFAENKYARTLVVDSENNIWLGTTNGLFKLIERNNDFEIIPYKKLINSKKLNHKSLHNILSIYESKDKDIWIGTDGSGLIKLNPKTNSFVFYTDLGLNEKSISSIVEYKNKIWIGGKSGIYQINPKNNEILNYTKSDGLLTNDFNNNSALVANNMVYFGSYEGVNYFSPDILTSSNSDSKLFFTKFKLFNKNVTPQSENSPLIKSFTDTKEIELSHDQTVFTIEYTGLNYDLQSNLQYAYKLEGFDKNWNNVGSTTSATYTNIEPGDYIFKLKLNNRGNQDSEKLIELKIKVTPPWWKTIYAFIFYIICIYLISKYLFDVYQDKFKQKQALQLEKERASQLEKLNDKKLQFFTNISHEFRTPLTLIINPLERIIKENSDELSKETLSKLKVIYKSSDRLSRLINELMDFNKLQFNKIQLKIQKIEVVSFILDVVEYFYEEANLRNIKFSFETNHEKFYAWLDPYMFEKIVYNIISNAFKFSQDDKTIYIKIHKYTAIEILPKFNNINTINSFSLNVEDQGTGLSKKDIKRIFDRFYQVNNLNKAYYGSTGIGLEVVKEFVNLHYGFIQVDSELGVGTSFEIIFPGNKEIFSPDELIEEEFQLNKPKNRVINEIRKSKNKSEIDVLSLNSESNEKIYTLLIVEDNSDLRNYLKSELEKYYKVVTASNGKRGYEIAIEKLPDLIITDVIMPEMNGLEMCNLIKNDQKTSHIPILMLSARALVDDKLQGINTGADIYLSKPFDLDILKSSLNQLLSSRQAILDKFYGGITKKSFGKINSHDNDFIQKVLKIINENLSEQFLSVEFLSEKVFLSRSQLFRKMKTLTGVSINEFIRNVRLERSKELLETTDLNINEISTKVGFTSPSYFSKCFKEKYNYLPTQLNKRI